VVLVVVVPDTVVTTSTSGVLSVTLSLSVVDIFSSTASTDGKETSAGNSIGIVSPSGICKFGSNAPT
jgi:hypothetical protein